MTARACFLFGAARSGTNAITWALEKHKDIACFNENSSIAFNNYVLQPNSVLMSIISKTNKQVVFFKSFHDTPRYYDIIRGFPDSRAIYSIRRPDHCIRSFAKEFGEVGKVIWLDRWRHALDYGAGYVMQMCVGDERSKDVALKNAELVLDLIGRRGDSIENVAAAYYYWQHSFLINSDILPSSYIKIVDYDDLVDNPQIMLSQICEWFQIGAIENDAGIAKDRRRTDGDGCNASSELLALCNNLYNEIQSVSQNRGKFIRV